MSKVQYMYSEVKKSIAECSKEVFFVLNFEF